MNQGACNTGAPRGLKNIQSGDATEASLTAISSERATRNLANSLRQYGFVLVLNVASDAPDTRDWKIVSTWLGEMGAEEGMTSFHIGITADAKLSEIIRAGARSLAIFEEVADLDSESADGTPEYLAAYALIERRALAYTRDVMGPEPCYSIARNYVKKLSLETVRDAEFSEEDLRIMATYGWVSISCLDDADRLQYLTMVRGMNQEVWGMIESLFEAVGVNDLEMDPTIAQARIEQVLSSNW